MELRIIRRKQNLTQAEFAKRIGTSQISIARYETNERRIPSWVALRVAEEFGLSAEELRSLLQAGAEVERHVDRGCDRGPDMHTDGTGRDEGTEQGA